MKFETLQKIHQQMNLARHVYRGHQKVSQKIGDAYVRSALSRGDTALQRFSAHAKMSFLGGAYTPHSELTNDYKIAMLENEPGMATAVLTAYFAYNVVVPTLFGDCIAPGNMNGLAAAGVALGLGTGIPSETLQANIRQSEGLNKSIYTALNTLQQYGIAGLAEKAALDGAASLHQQKRGYAAAAAQVTAIVLGFLLALPRAAVSLGIIALTSMLRFSSAFVCLFLTVILYPFTLNPDKLPPFFVTPVKLTGLLSEEAAREFFSCSNTLSGRLGKLNGDLEEIMSEAGAMAAVKRTFAPTTCADRKAAIQAEANQPLIVRTEEVRRGLQSYQGEAPKIEAAVAELQLASPVVAQQLAATAQRLDSSIYHLADTLWHRELRRYVGGRSCKDLTEAELTQIQRRAALLSHPDKVGGNDVGPVASEFGRVCFELSQELGSICRFLRRTRPVAGAPPAAEPTVLQLQDAA
jgi:hypothetical protein